VSPSPSPAAATVPAAPLDLASIRRAIEAGYSGRFNSIGEGAGVVMVGFRSTEEELAKQIVDTYGSKVQVTVGFFRYPATAAPGNPCPQTWRLVAPGALHAVLKLPNRIGHGWFQTHIEVTNAGAAAVNIESGEPLLVFFFRPGATAPIGAYDGSIAGIGLTRTIGPRGLTSIDAVGGTASCDISLGYELPDGDYIARGVVETGSGAPISAFLTDPLPVTIAVSP